MFSKHKGKNTICIHVWDTKPNTLIDDARRLRETLKQNAQKDVNPNLTPTEPNDDDDSVVSDIFEAQSENKNMGILNKTK